VKADKLLQMKEEIEAANLDIARLRGQEENFQKQLLETTGTKKLSQAKKEVTAKKKLLKKKITKFEKNIKNLEKKYPWG